jgi:predicted NodU family carbamoyl transferase|tara:strand:+ start:12357 stop:12578 length:222 start_codon:yes stop_codon:yes gene_type:complete
MFTVDMVDDESRITLLDETGELDDVIVNIYDDYCHIIQHDDTTGRTDVITMTSQQYWELMQAWNKSTGAYKTT